MAFDYHDVIDRADGDGYHDSFPDYCKSRSFKYSNRLYFADDRNPFNIFLFRQVFVSLPDDIYEAAQLDFCGPVKYFFTMVLPMSKTVVATVSVFTFLGVWNDYLWPSLVFTSSDLLTAQIGLNSITSNDNTTMGQVLAVITLITIPVMIIYALFSKQIVEGVTSTGSKEG